MSELAEALESLATLLEADRKNTLKRTLTVAAFLGFDSRGKGRGPATVEVGDELYVQGVNDPASGMLSKDASQTPFARAARELLAGLTAELPVVIYEKRWVVDGNPCELCQGNADVGWIPADEDFPSGDDEPGAHPNCQCDLETRYRNEHDRW